MKTEKIAEKARELYPFNEYSPDAEFDAYIKGYREATAEWQEKVRLSTLLIRISVDDLKTANYEIDRRGLYKVIYDALEIIGEK